MQSSNTRYRDTWQEFQTMREMARARVTAPPPAMAGVQCPAAHGTFAVMDETTQTWRQLNQQEYSQLVQAVTDTGICCQGRINSCPIRHTQQKETPEQ